MLQRLLTLVLLLAIVLAALNLYRSIRDENLQPFHAGRAANLQPQR